MNALDNLKKWAILFVYHTKHGHKMSTVQLQMALETELLNFCPFCHASYNWEYISTLVREKQDGSVYITVNAFCLGCGDYNDRGDKVREFIITPEEVLMYENNFYTAYYN